MSTKRDATGARVGTLGALELGSSSDNTLSRSAAGILAVEGVAVPLNSTSNTHTAQQLELGHASDTTFTRVSAGVAAVEGKNIALNGTSEALTTGTIELGHASDTTLSRAAAGVLNVEGKAVLQHNGAYTSGQVYFSTSDASGGSSGDVWFKYTA